jgi:hypothetical protein
MCRWPDCDQPAKIKELCRLHYSRFHKSGMTLDALLALWTPLCSMGCGAPSEALDHDHTCCDQPLRPGAPNRYGGAVVYGRIGTRRCGNCNRGFVCRACNVMLGVRDRRRLMRV